MARTCLILMSMHVSLKHACAHVCTHICTPCDTAVCTCVSRHVWVAAVCVWQRRMSMPMSVDMSVDVSVQIPARTCLCTCLYACLYTCVCTYLAILFLCTRLYVCTTHRNHTSMCPSMYVSMPRSGPMSWTHVSSTGAIDRSRSPVGYNYIGHNYVGP